MVVGYCQPVGGVISWSSGILCLSIYIFEVKLILDLNLMLGPKYAYIYFMGNLQSRIPLKQSNIKYRQKLRWDIHYSLVME
jgi:hypothetical protein